MHTEGRAVLCMRDTRRAERRQVCGSATCSNKYRVGECIVYMQHMPTHAVLAMKGALLCTLLLHIYAGHCVLVSFRVANDRPSHTVERILHACVAAQTDAKSAPDSIHKLSTQPVG